MSDTGKKDPALILKEGLEKLGEQIEELERKSKELLKNLQDRNSQFPETKKFLESKGLSHVRELDSNGIGELETYLLSVYKQILGQTN